MPRALRSPCFALATLAAFLLAQPAMACAALCLLQSHHAVAHATAGLNRERPHVGAGACHTANVAPAQQDLFRVLSSMAPARPITIAAASARWVDPVRTLLTPPGPISRTVELPPPRFV